MTVMTGWDLFEDLRAAQDEMLRAASGRGWWPGQQFTSSAYPRGLGAGGRHLRA